MQKKRLNNNALLDRLHRGAVLTCLGVTVVGTLFLGTKLYYYYTVIKPERQKTEFKQLISEGAHDKAEEMKY